MIRLPRIYQIYLNVKLTTKILIQSPGVLSDTLGISVPRKYTQQNRMLAKNIITSLPSTLQQVMYLQFFCIVSYHNAEGLIQKVLLICC